VRLGGNFGTVRDMVQIDLRFLVFEQNKGAHKKGADPKFPGAGGGWLPGGTVRGGKRLRQGLFQRKKGGFLLLGGAHPPTGPHGLWKGKNISA